MHVHFEVAHGRAPKEEEEEEEEIYQNTQVVHAVGKVVVNKLGLHTHTHTHSRGSCGVSREEIYYVAYAKARVHPLFRHASSHQLTGGKLLGSLLCLQNNF